MGYTYVAGCPSSRRKDGGTLTIDGDTDKLECTQDNFRRVVWRRYDTAAAKHLTMQQRSVICTEYIISKDTTRTVVKEMIVPGKSGKLHYMYQVWQVKWS